MKTKAIIILLVVFNLTILTNVSKAVIDEVYITPEIPSTKDTITIFVSGIQGSGPVEINNTELFIDEYSLELDIFLTVGFLTWVTPWDYSEGIGTLSAGTYNLLVKTDQPTMSGLEDTYSITFEVIPEPTTLLFLSVGLLGLIHRKR